MEIRICPTCGSGKIHKVRRDVSGRRHGQLYAAPRVEFYECPECGEQLFDHAAMQRIESFLPKRTGRRAS